jgi:hypothetical protein
MEEDTSMLEEDTSTPDDGTSTLDDDTSPEELPLAAPDVAWWEETCPALELTEPLELLELLVPASSSPGSTGGQADQMAAEAKSGMMRTPTGKTAFMEPPKERVPASSQGNGSKFPRARQPVKGQFKELGGGRALRYRTAETQTGG